ESTCNFRCEGFQVRACIVLSLEAPAHPHCAARQTQRFPCLIRCEAPPPGRLEKFLDLANECHRVRVHFCTLNRLGRYCRLWYLGVADGPPQGDNGECGGRVRPASPKLPPQL